MKGVFFCFNLIYYVWEPGVIIESMINHWEISKFELFEQWQRDGFTNQPKTKFFWMVLG